MEADTSQAPTFLRNAIELSVRFEKDPSPVARAITSEALALVEFFRRWKIQSPTNAERVEAIHHLLDLTRRAAEYAAYVADHSRT
jgi:hypothetical protein